MWDCGKSRTFAAELKTVRKKKMKLLAASLLAVASMNANAEAMDSVRNVELEEISVVSGMKENGLMRQQPASSMVISSATMEANQGKSLKALSHLVPNLFIPDYGSHLTSAFYIRGIGSRINTPAVGLYVDDLPYFDKSAFDFNLSDVERVDVLRGPQGTAEIPLEALCVYIRRILSTMREQTYRSVMLLETIIAMRRFLIFIVSRIGLPSWLEATMKGMTASSRMT